MKLSILILLFVGACSGVVRHDQRITDELTGNWERPHDRSEQIGFDIDGQYYGYTGSTAGFSGIAETRGDSIVTLISGPCSTENASYGFTVVGDSLYLSASSLDQCVYSLHGYWRRPSIGEF